MKEHISEIHEEGKKPFKCDICDHCFSQNGSLKIHMLPVHDEKKPFKCELVITALLTRAVRLNTLLQFTMLRNHSNVTFVTPVFTKINTLLRFMKVRNLSHVIYLCNQSYLKKESLRRHISAVHWKVIWSKRHILSVHDEKPNYSNAVFVKHWFQKIYLWILLLSNPLLGFLAINNKSK